MSPGVADLVAFSNYSPQAGSTRVRLYDWIDHLGLRARAQCYAGLPNSRPATLLRHLPAVIAAERELRRLDVRGERVIVSRSASPLSRGELENRILREAAHSVYDFDDAVHLVTSWRDRVGGAPEKFATCVRAADTVLAGNDHLADVASELSGNVVMVPSCVEPDDYLPKGDWTLPSRPRVVWVGSAATEEYLLDVLPALDRLWREGGIELKVISTGRPNPRFGDRPWITYVPWTAATAAADLREADVAVAPLTDTAFARGKCAYKLLQYAATGLPIVGSPVGANRLALERFGGSIAERDWYEPLKTLLTASAGSRQVMGERGIAMVRRWYSFEAWAPTWRAAMGL